MIITGKKDVLKKIKKLLVLSLMFCAWVSYPTSVEAKEVVTLTLSERQLSDLELLLNKGFAPLETFMDSRTYERVVHEMRLLDDTVWPIPITLDVCEEVKQKVTPGTMIALCDREGAILAQLEVSEIWSPDKMEEAQYVYGTTNKEHPGVAYLLDKTGAYYLSGALETVALPKHYDFISLRRTPEELKRLFKEQGIEKVVAFQTRNPMHRAHVELTKRAAAELQAHLLLHPAVGETKPGDVDYFTRVKCYQKLQPYYPEDSVTLSLLPIAMRMAGPREALWHAIIRKNYGCTHFIVGRDHAGPGRDGSGKSFYAPYEAQELVSAYEDEIGIEMVPFQEMVYVAEDQDYQPIDQVSPSKTILSLSGSQLREMLRRGHEIPSWFTYPEIIAELQKKYPPCNQQGFTLFFTGFSGAGKSAIANAVAVKLMEIQDRPVTLLDGDLIRKNLSQGLGFSREHRSINVRRVGFVANEIAKNHGVAICALIAPYAEDRLFNRELINLSSHYVEIYVSTPLNVCEERDPKGLYMLARSGKLKEFTGIDDPYEIPKQPEIEIDSSLYTIDESVEKILEYLTDRGFLNIKQYNQQKGA